MSELKIPSDLQKSYEHEIEIAPLLGQSRGTGKSRLIERVARAEAENDKLRALLAKGKGDCVYCGLPAAEISKCAKGFPGCGRMDDIVNAPETETEQQNIALIFRLHKAKEIVLAYACGHMTEELTQQAEDWLKEGFPDGRKPEPTI